MCEDSPADVEMELGSAGPGSDSDSGPGSVVDLPPDVDEDAMWLVCNSAINFSLCFKTGLVITRNPNNSTVSKLSQGVPQRAAASLSALPSSTPAQACK